MAARPARTRARPAAMSDRGVRRWMARAWSPGAGRPGDGRDGEGDAGEGRSRCDGWRSASAVRRRPRRRRRRSDRPRLSTVAGRPARARRVPAGVRRRRAGTSQHPPTPISSRGEQPAGRRSGRPGAGRLRPPPGAPPAGRSAPGRRRRGAEEPGHRRNGHHARQTATSGSRPRNTHRQPTWLATWAASAGPTSPGHHPGRGQGGEHPGPAAVPGRPARWRRRRRPAPRRPRSPGPPGRRRGPAYLGPCRRWPGRPAKTSRPPTRGSPTPRLSETAPLTTMPTRLDEEEGAEDPAVEPQVAEVAADHREDGRHREALEGHHGDGHGQAGRSAGGRRATTGPRRRLVANTAPMTQTTPDAWVMPASLAAIVRPRIPVRAGAGSCSSGPQPS